MTVVKVGDCPAREMDTRAEELQNIVMMGLKMSAFELEAIEDFVAIRRSCAEHGRSARNCVGLESLLECDG